MTYLEKLQEAIEIFMNRCPDLIFESDHDVIFGPSLDIDFTELEMERLYFLGWFEDEQYDCWTL